MGNPGRPQIMVEFSEDEWRTAYMAPGIGNISGTVDTGRKDKSLLHDNVSACAALLGTTVCASFSNAHKML
ncbi:hypothetical protein [Rhizobium laguerreae]|uniref:hypothetical protein n=1 Tax=Rhizobium laguerreae TaxID=1076926 RepID=UPI001FEA781A|nr:hypothetical protein [Rhizobium laguerreae]